METPVSSYTSIAQTISIIRHGINLLTLNFALLASIFAALLLCITLRQVLDHGQLKSLPVVGHSGLVSSYITAIRWIKHGNVLLDEGFTLYKDAAFRIANLDRWHVFITGDKLSEELRKAKETELSFKEYAYETLAFPYTVGAQIHRNPYHVKIIRSQMTHNISVLFEDLMDEIRSSFNDMGLVDSEWRHVPALKTFLTVTSRATNRIFVGLPLCRDAGYCKSSTSFTADAMKVAFIVRMCPAPLRFVVGNVLKLMLWTSHSKNTRGVKSMIKHRLRLLEHRDSSFDYPKKCNDLLSWLLDEAVGEERSPNMLLSRYLAINLAATHSTSMTLTQAMFNLACMPQYAEPMRREVEAVVSEHGWSSGALSKMYLVDSFLKETLRMTSSIPVTRKAMRDYIFSDGTSITAGTFVSIPARLTHLDNEVYHSAAEFLGFRFSDKRKCDGESTMHQLVSTSATYLAFGHGSQACPGRFFAANIMKAMLAHVLVTCDVQIEGDKRPDNKFVWGACIPDPDVNIMLRRRVECTM